MNEARRDIISLRSKLILAISLVLLLVISGLEYRGFLRHMHNQTSAVMDSLGRAEDVFQVMLENSFGELYRIADNYALTDTSAKALASKARPSLLAGIESVHFYSFDGRDLLDSKRASVPEAIRGIVADIALSKRPVGFIDCNGICIQRAFIPLIADNGSEVIANINRDATVLLQDFFNLTHFDVALLVKEQAQSVALETVLLASNPASNKDILLPLVERVSLLGSSDQKYLGQINSTYYSAARIDVANPFQQAIEFFIYNQRNDIAQLNAARLRDAVITVAATLLFCILLISAILRGPLNKILAISELLRMLPDGRFTDAKKGLNEMQGSALRRDETDILRENLVGVIEDLERLHRKNLDQREKLKQKIIELTEATRFNDMLLDASPLIIMIHDQKGSLYNINALGRQLTGTSLEQEQPPNINEWVRSDYQHRSLSEALANLLQEDGRTVQGEMPLFDRSGRRMEILWVHRSIRVMGQPRILSMGMDVTEQHEAARSLQWLGRHDRVTGLLNRISFIDEASTLIAHADSQSQFDLVLFDIDDFARFNDQFDFSTGDKLLQELARHISFNLPETSLLSRSGSGEFMAFVERDERQGESDYQRMLETMTRYYIDTNVSTEAIHISIVVNHISQQQGLAIDQLISDTTALMVRVKSKARGQVFLATEEHIDRLSRQEKYYVKDLLQRALDEKRLILFYQPIVSTRDQRVSHCESLVRMLDEDGQLIPPLKFLSVAAELGMMSQIDYAVMEMAMQQQRRWQDQGIDIGLSINLTAHTMELMDFESRLQQLIEVTGANPAKLIFEVVETDALEDLKSGNELLSNFRKIGARIALDDFGVGFTSFEYVRELPVDYIKIDQSFVRFIHERPNDQALVRSMIEMSHSLNKQVIVEGVETLEALEMLVQMGAEYVQGYYLSRPMPLDSLNLDLTLDKLLTAPSDI